MLVLASPPGGGKTTITRELMKVDPQTVISVSATTRAKRPGEVEGQHYYFVSPEKFKQMADNGEMLEHALVYNKNYYGTPKAPVEKALAAGKDVLFDIDWQGNRRLTEIAPDDVVSIFLLPPSWADLENRLHSRAQDSEAEISRRLGMAGDEISHYKEFDYVIVNNDLGESIRQVRGILDAERLKRTRQCDVQEFVATLKPE
jgi:guanylate kinase